MQRHFRLGGGVSPRNTRLRGQSIIEYVLIITVIGLVVIFAGPQVSGAIRNQFNQVTSTVDSGTSGDGFISAEEKAHQEAMKNIAAKNCRNWSLDELKEVATDISKNGTSSVVYAKAKAAMDAGTTWSVKLTNGKTMTYRIIGINHDDLADGSGKAGLTFWATGVAVGSHRMNATNTNAGGWEKSELRQKMNSGEIWNLMPADFQSKVRPVNKLTNNVGGIDKNAVVTATTDKLFLLSYSEIVDTPRDRWSEYSWIYKEGDQYEVFKDRTGTSSFGYGRERTISPEYSSYFLAVSTSLNPDQENLDTNGILNVCPAFCF